MKNILIISENKYNYGKIINLDKVCVIVKKNKKIGETNIPTIDFIFDNEENQETWRFELKEECENTYNDIISRLIKDNKSLVG